MATSRLDPARARRKWLPFDHERAAASTAAEGRRGPNSCAVDSRNRRDSLRHIREEPSRRIAVGRIAASSDAESDQDKTFAHESGIHAAEATKALAKEGRADEEETRERDLRGDERTQDPLLVSLCGPTAAA